LSRPRSSVPLQPAFASLPPLALYVHLPWCVRKCPYCDFNSHTQRGELDEARYVQALLADLDRELPAVWGRAVHSVFIGGGTPSLFSPEAIDRLLAGVNARVRVSPAAEVTLEANPGSVDSARLRGFVQAGVTRLSVGVQSFDDAVLPRIGRIHDAAAARAAVHAALASGAARVNVDLMFALPGQDTASVGQDVATVLGMGVEHVSFYQLTLEPNTAFHRNPPPLPAEAAAARMHEQGIGALAAAGLERYEVSAFARPPARCRHNLNYWRFGDYLGIGAGAHGKITRAAPAAVTRSVKQRHPARYLAAALAGDADLSRGEVAAAELPFEFMLNALRLCAGVEAELFSATTGLPLDVIADALARAREDGLLLDEPQRIVPSVLGQRFLDDLVARFLPRGTSVYTPGTVSSSRAT
jgi:oxygen-independent coproporphyrinogen-3 oxidase